MQHVKLEKFYILYICVRQNKDYPREQNNKKTVVIAADTQPNAHITSGTLVMEQIDLIIIIQFGVRKKLNYE